MTIPSNGLVALTQAESPSPDLLAITKFKNLRLWELKGENTWRELSISSGVTVVKLCGYASLYLLPFRKDGMHTRSARKIADYFDVLVEELFPASLYALPLPGKVERTFSSIQLLPMLEARRLNLLPENSIAEDDLNNDIDLAKLKERLSEVLLTLSPRESKILQMRFGFDGEPTTLRETAMAFGIRAERVRQLEARALRKLRCPSRASLLRDFLPDHKGSGHQILS